MIPSGRGKKIIALQCFKVIFVLTKDMILFCWCMIKKLPRSHKKIFYNIFYWHDTDLSIKDIICSPKGSKHFGAPLGYSMSS